MKEGEGLAVLTKVIGKIMKEQHEVAKLMVSNHAFSKEYAKGYSISVAYKTTDEKRERGEISIIGYSTISPVHRLEFEVEFSSSGEITDIRPKNGVEQYELELEAEKEEIH